MLTGDQVREACELLWWDRLEVQRQTGLALANVDRILASQGAIGATETDEAALREAFIRAGLVFTPKGSVKFWWQAL